MDGSVNSNPKGIYNAFRFSQASTQVIGTHASKNRRENTSNPLFLYLALQNMHSPFQCPSKYFDLYPDIEYEPERTYMAMMSVLDELVGNVTKALKNSRLWDNSFLIWTSDNGASTSGGSNYPLRGSKQSLFEGGTRTPAVVSGGLLPVHRRGTSSKGMVHIAGLCFTLILKQLS